MLMIVALECMLGGGPMPMSVCSFTMSSIPCCYHVANWAGTLANQHPHILCTRQVPYACRHYCRSFNMSVRTGYIIRAQEVQDGTNYMISYL